MRLWNLFKPAFIFFFLTLLLQGEGGTTCYCQIEVETQIPHFDSPLIIEIRGTSSLLGVNENFFPHMVSIDTVVEITLLKLGDGGSLNSLLFFILPYPSGERDQGCVLTAR